MLITHALLTATGTIPIIVTTITVFVSSKLLVRNGALAPLSIDKGEAKASLPIVPEFFVAIQKSVPFKVHYLLRAICSIGGVGFIISFTAKGKL